MIFRSARQNALIAAWELPWGRQTHDRKPCPCCYSSSSSAKRSSAAMSACVWIKNCIRQTVIFQRMETTSPRKTLQAPETKFGHDWWAKSTSKKVILLLQWLRSASLQGQTWEKRHCLFFLAVTLILEKESCCVNTSPGEFFMVQ